MRQAMGQSLALSSASTASVGPGVGGSLGAGGSAGPADGAIVPSFMTGEGGGSRVPLSAIYTQDAAGGAGAGAAGGSSSSSAPSASSSSSSKMYCVIEKNFRIYAYTSLPLHIALLSLFAHIDYRLPNLVVASLTRSSVLKAVSRGITAQSIHHFLLQRIHPAVLAEGGAVVPENVVDQLYLWERERHRVQFQEGSMLLTGFDSLAAYRECLAFFQGIGGPLLALEDSRKLVVEEAQLPQFKAWIASRAASSAANAAAVGAAVGAALAGVGGGGGGGVSFPGMGMAGMAAPPYGSYAAYGAAYGAGGMGK